MTKHLGQVNLLNKYTKKARTLAKTILAFWLIMIYAASIMSLSATN